VVAGKKSINARRRFVEVRVQFDLGGAVQVDPIKPNLKPPGTRRVETNV
jgi:hypothetical protein